jgi:hypothetical protein
LQLNPSRFQELSSLAEVSRQRTEFFPHNSLDLLAHGCGTLAADCCSRH